MYFLEKLWINFFVFQSVAWRKQHNVDEILKTITPDEVVKDLYYSHKTKDFDGRVSKWKYNFEIIFIFFLKFSDFFTHLYAF